MTQNFNTLVKSSNYNVLNTKVIFITIFRHILKKGKIIMLTSIKKIERYANSKVNRKLKSKSPSPIKPEIKTEHAILILLCSVVRIG